MTCEIGPENGVMEITMHLSDREETVQLLKAEKCFARSCKTGARVILGESIESLNCENILEFLSILQNIDNFSANLFINLKVKRVELRKTFRSR